jgi:hypothetical protein
MMQIHKAQHYERLVAESVEMVRNTINVFTSGSRGIVTDAGPLRRRHLLRLVEISLIDIDIMVENIEKAHDSYHDILQEWAKGLPGEVWNHFEKRMSVCLENAQHEKERLEKEKKLVEQQPVEELPFGLDERIKALSEQLDSRLRKETLDTYRTLRNANNPVGALLQLCRASLCLMNLLFATVHENAPSSKSRPSDNLYECIVRAGRSDEKTKGLGILPDEMASLLHTIRTYSNKADHDAEKVRLTVEDAEIGLTLFLRVVEWFYCEYDKGPRLLSIYNHRNGKALI